MKIPSFLQVVLGSAVMLFSYACGPSGSSSGEFYSIGFSSIKQDSIILPLDSITEGGVRMVKLENCPKAFFGTAFTTLITDNYIGIQTQYMPGHFKLFDKQGKYLRDIGRHGRGPNEYQMIDFSQIDEQAGRVYILPFTGDKIFTYGLDGSFCPPIPLARRTQRACFDVRPDSTVVVVSISKSDDPGENEIFASVWLQDMEGNVIREKQIKPVGQGVAFSSIDKNITDSANISLTFFDSGTDTLYRYDVGENLYIPRFAVNDVGKKIHWSIYTELPSGFVGYYCQTETPQGYYTDPVSFYVDKKTGEAGCYQWKIDEMGGMTGAMEPRYFRDGYFVFNQSAMMMKGMLGRQIGEMLRDSTRTIDSVRVAGLVERYYGLHEEDNNVILYAKLKQNAE